MPDHHGAQHGQIERNWDRGSGDERAFGDQICRGILSNVVSVIPHDLRSQSQHVQSASVESVKIDARYRNWSKGRQSRLLGPRVAGLTHIFDDEEVEERI